MKRVHATNPNVQFHVFIRRWEIRKFERFSFQVHLQQRQGHERHFRAFNLPEYLNGGDAERSVTLLLVVSAFSLAFLRFSSDRL